MNTCLGGRDRCLDNDKTKNSSVLVVIFRSLFGSIREISIIESAL